jgi:uncharacterized protein YjbI with pentapeptide repeats
MDFHKIAGKTIQRPNFEDEDLAEDSPAFRGEFDFESALLIDGDQEGVTGEGSVSSTLVKSVDLSKSRLAPLSLSDVRFDDVNLSNAVLSETTARRVEFQRCQAIGLQAGFVQAQDVYAEDCRFDYATLRFDQVKNAVVFRRCSFRETVLAGDLSNVVFDDCELTETEFEATRAVGCDLTESRLIGVRGLLTLRGARLSADQASSLASQIASEAGLTIVR